MAHEYELAVHSLKIRKWTQFYCNVDLTSFRKMF